MLPQASLSVYFKCNGASVPEVLYANAHGRNVLDVTFRLGRSGRSDRSDCGRHRPANAEVIEAFY